MAANVTFATPYAILILQQYARLIPIELDEAKVKDWLSKGAQPSDPVAKLIKAAGITI